MTGLDILQLWLDEHPALRWTVALLWMAAICRVAGLIQ